MTTDLLFVTLLTVASAECDISLYDTVSDSFSAVTGNYTATITVENEEYFRLENAFGCESILNFRFKFNEKFLDYDLIPTNITHTAPDSDGNIVYFLAASDSTTQNITLDLLPGITGLSSTLLQLRVNGSQSYGIKENDGRKHIYVDFAGADQETREISPWLTLHATWVDDPEGSIPDLVSDDVMTTTEYFDLTGRRMVMPEKGFYIIRKGRNITKSFIVR